MLKYVWRWDPYQPARSDWFKVTQYCLGTPGGWPAIWTPRPHCDALKQNLGRGLLALIYSTYRCAFLLSRFSHFQLCVTMDCSLPVSYLHGLFQASILEWVAMPSSRGSFQPRDLTLVSYSLQKTTGAI